MIKKKEVAHVHLLHNPKAGDQDHVKEELIHIIESNGFTCQYASIKDKGWKRFKKETALVVVAGGDGTVREVMKKLLDRRILDKRLAIALLPSGTANNFAKTLEIAPDIAALERCLVTWNLKKIDVGAVSGLRGARFFLEGLGCGLIPKLITEMKDADLSGVDSADQELQVALNKMMDIAKHYRAKRAKITIDGNTYEDNYLLVEVLNIRSVGPNLILAPEADPADGKFEVVLLKEADRAVFIDYVHQLQHTTDDRRLKAPWDIVEATREIVIQCENRLIHVDDELITVKKGKAFKINVRPGILDVIT